MAAAENPSPSLAPLREVIARHGLKPRRSLGQHFLFDLNLCARIARAAGDLSKTNVIEIGPGPGGLTRALLEAGAMRVFAVETDGRCIEALADLGRAYPDRLRLIHADALETGPVDIAPAPRAIVANLPYNIATPLLIGWLRQAQELEGMTCMFQAEVADRLAAKPSTKAYGRLSVITQWLCEVSHQFNVDKRAFTPPPRVASSVV
ncbi:MAG: 16S rRNA (adenine(1518)-N(6)/adenine(1519)-N(6))-dimethyltransferase RsmA, partial [Rhodospirillales bacterium]